MNNNISSEQINNIEQPNQVESRKLGSLALIQKNEEISSRNEDPVAKAKTFISRYGRLLSVFSRDSSLEFVLSPSESTFSFDADKCCVNVPIGWFENESYTDHELLFANYHERGHFIDMRKQPEVFLDNFAQMEKDAEKLSSEYAKNNPSSDKKALKGQFYNGLHDLYNCLDDIYVNKLVKQRVPFFQKGDGEAAIDTLYEKAGFADADMRGQPLHSQFVYSLLRDAMFEGKKEKSIVDDAVSKALNTKILGLNVPQTVHEQLEPSFGIQIDPKKRYDIIRSLIQPKYVELLKKDIESKEKDSQNNQSSEGGNGESEEASGDSQNTSQQSDIAEQYHNSIIGGGFDDEVIKQILDKYKDLNDDSPENRIKRYDKSHGIEEHQREEDTKFKERNEAARHEMRAFWKRLIGKSIEYRRNLVSGQRKGRFNTRSAIRNFANIEDASRQGKMRELEIYDRFETQREVIDQPEEIEVTLLVDCSGSMSGERVEYAKQTAALLMYSIKDFNEEIEKSNSRTQGAKSKLRAYTQVITFGSDFEEEKKFDKKTPKIDTDANIIKAFTAIGAHKGGTDDAAPLEFIKQSITKKDEDRIKDKKLKKIVFEITDGEPDNARKTAENIRALSEKGVTMVGFQIGEVSQRDQEEFNDIWKDGNGIFIGRDIQSLPERLIKELSDSLSNIVI